MKNLDCKPLWHKVVVNDGDSLPDYNGDLCLIQLITKEYCVAEFYDENKPVFERKLGNGEVISYDPFYVSRWMYIKELN